MGVPPRGCGVGPRRADAPETHRAASTLGQPFLRLALARPTRRPLRPATPKAVIAVDLYGQTANLDPIGEACQRHGVELIEDAGEALGATHRGRPAGSAGRIGVFSFNGNKIITTSAPILSCGVMWG